jgi:hypothetical protein
VAQLLARGDDQRLEMVDRLGAGAHGAAPRDQQHPHGLALAAAARPGEMLATERFVCGTDRVQLVGLGAVAPRRPRRAVDLDDPLALLEQEHRQAGAEAAAGLDRPHAPTAGVAAHEPQQPPVAERVGGLGAVRHHHSGDRDDRRRVRVAVGVDADDVSDVLCEHAHANLPRGELVGGRPGKPRGETVMGHAPSPGRTGF